MDDQKSWVSKHQNLGVLLLAVLFLFFCQIILAPKKCFCICLFCFVLFCLLDVVYIVGKTPGLYAIVVKGKLQRGGHDYDNDDQTDY